MSISATPSNEVEETIKHDENIQTLSQLYRQLSEQRVKLLYKDQPRAKRKYKRISNEITSLIEEMMKRKEPVKDEEKEIDTEEIVLNP